MIGMKELLNIFKIKYILNFIIMGKLTNKLEQLIKEIRDLSKEQIESDDLTEEQLYHLREGFKQGLFSTALLLADELDAETNGDNGYLEQEEEWWNENIRVDEKFDEDTDELNDKLNKEQSEDDFNVRVTFEVTCDSHTSMGEGKSIKERILSYIDECSDAMDESMRHWGDHIHCIDPITVEIYNDDEELIDVSNKVFDEE